MQIDRLFLCLLTMDSPPLDIVLSPTCIFLRLAVTYRINHLRLLLLAPTKSFCRRLRSHCRLCQPIDMWTLLCLLGGWEIGSIPKTVDCRQQAFTALSFLLLTYLESLLGFCKWYLPFPGHAYHIQLVQSWREFVVNRDWSKPKCHTDTDFSAPSGQEMLSKSRSCNHKLTLELATAGEGGGGRSLTWIGLILHTPCQPLSAH